MTALMLICHAPLGHALHAVACHAFGRYIAEVVVADIAANASLDDAISTIETVWKQEGKPKEIVLLGDILGATPCNAACGWLALHPELNARGLTGVSVPMMLKAMTYRELPPAELVERLADTVSPSCAPLSAIR
ncbi:MAG: hypothetical protein FGM22_03680 [Burkholderiaceae bacterium]|jgi:PTS system mannose-specific IIA component|nr:hypothetical protein [Burkholderiaceae bacterium]